MKGFFTLCLVLFSIVAFAQADSTIDRMSYGIVFRMDSLLNLTSTQREQVKLYTDMLFKDKRDVRTKSKEITRSELQRQLQVVENKRDSLYKIALPDKLFKVYKDHKGYILSGFNSLPNN